MDLSKYYSEISRYKSIGAEEEVALFKTFQATTTTEKEKTKIKDRIISSNLRFAFKEAKKFSKNDPILFEDLICAANEGLLVGFEKFNPANGVRYLSYAGWWVKQRILDEMSKKRIVSLPKSKQQLATRIQKAKDRDESLSLADLVKVFPEDNPKDIKELSDTRYLTYYMEDLSDDLLEIDPIGEQVQINIDNNKVWKSVSDLPSPHREVIAQLFGLDDGVEQSITNICKSMKVSKETVRQIKAEGLEMLTRKLGPT
jgi:RNA polymerase primary sigma factor